MENDRAVDSFQLHLLFLFFFFFSFFFSFGKRKKKLGACIIAANWYLLCVMEIQE